MMVYRIVRCDHGHCWGRDYISLGIFDQVSIQTLGDFNLASTSSVHRKQRKRTGEVVCLDVHSVT